MDYEGVCRDMRLADGTLWPMPIMLDVTREVASGLEPGSKFALRDLEGVMLAVLNVEDVWEADRESEACSPRQEPVLSRNSRAFPTRTRYRKTPTWPSIPPTWRRRNAFRRSSFTWRRKATSRHRPTAHSPERQARRGKTKVVSFSRLGSNRAAQEVSGLDRLCVKPRFLRARLGRTRPHARKFAPYRSRFGRKRGSAYVRRASPRWRVYRFLAIVPWLRGWRWAPAWCRVQKDVCP